MKNNIYTAIPDWFNKVQSQSTDNTSTTTTQTTIIGGGGSIGMSVHNLFIKSDTTITIDDFTISDLFVTDQITDTENWLTAPLLHTLPNTEVSVTTAAQQLYIGAYDKNNNQIKLYQFSEAISTVVIPENCYYLRASSNKTNTDLTIKYVGLNNFDETQQNKLESSSFQNFLTLVEGDEKGVITNSVQNLSLVFQNPLYYTLDKAGNVLISIDRDALFSQSENPTDDRYVTTVANSVQDILSSKNFKEGLSINGIEIVERNGFLYIKGNLATTGGITAYTDDPDDPGGSGGLPGGGAIGDIVITGSGNALVDASLSEDHSVITFTKGWLVDAESDQSITGVKDFINGLKLSGQLIKIVDGVLFLDCSIAATGGITAYATMPGEGSSSIMDQLVVDTKYFIITEEGVLTIVPGSVGGISNIYVTGNGNALTTVTLSEDGKTVSFTKDKNFADQAEMSAYKSEVNQTIAEFKNEVNEQLKHFVTLDTEQEITAIKHFIEGVTIGSNKHKFYEKDGVLWLEGDIAITGGITTYATENVDVSTIMDGVAVDEITITKGDDNVLRIKNAGAGSSFDENAMWSALSGSSNNQINKSHLTTALDGYATQNWVIENYATKSELSAVSNKLNDFLEGSDTDTIINKWKELEAFLSGMVETDNLAEILETKADKKYVDSTFVTLATKQTITGEKTFSSVLNTAAIKASGAITAPSLAVSDWVTIAGIKLRKLEDGALMLEGNLAVTGGITTYAIDPVSASTVMDGVVVDGTTIKKENGKLVAVGGGEAGSIQWENISGKPSVFATNIANITDLHSSWDSVLAAQKPAWLTAVSIATISDLNSGWDALLKADPSAYVTRWPTISEVTGKQNLIVKLNGGTTEGTNQFTYNATGAKTINITPAGIGSYTKSESDSKYPTKTGSGASGTWGINISGNASNADKLDGTHKRTGDTYWGVIPYIETDGTFEIGKYLDFHVTSSDTKDYSTRVQAQGAYNNIVNLPTANGNIALTSDNVASASKLQTTHTLWGQNFNGTQNVSGNMSNVGKISANGEIITSSANSFRAVYGSYGFFIRNDGVSTYFMHTNKDDPYGGYNNNRPITIDNASGRISINGALDVGSVTTFYNKVTGTSISCSDWHRSTGQTGWVNDSYGGGIYMTDATWVRVWNGKGFLCENTIESSYRLNARQLVNVYGALGYGWGSGQAAFQVAIPTNESQTPILLAYNGVNGNQTGNDRYFAIEVLNTGLRDVHFNVSGKETVRMRANYFEVNGDILATGGATFYGSDIRYKSIIHPVMVLALNKIAEAPSFVYRWNKPNMNQNRLNLGGSAQYTQTILPWAVEDNDNFLSMDYATVAYTFSVHTARHLLDYETKTDKEIRKLKNRIKYLEKQLKSLHYEEANIVDN